MALRVIVCYTGGVGSQVVRLLLKDPAFELVGVLVHSAEKDGKDVGEIIGIGTIGLKATRDVEALVALRADAMAWHGLTWQPEIVARFLSAGTSVYSSMGGWYLPSEPEFDFLQNAAVDGGAALIAGGNIPGLISDVLPLFCSGYSTNIRMIRATQRDHVPHYPSAIQLGKFIGLGQRMLDSVFDSEADLSEVDSLWLWGIKQSANIVARALNTQLDEIRLTNKEFGISPEDMVLQPSGLKISKGTVSGVRWTFTAFSCGQPFYELINEQTARLDIGGNWRATEDAANWSVVIEGSPSITCEFGLSVADQDNLDHVAALNAARSVNFLPRIAVAEPGWRTILEVPAPVGSRGDKT